MFQDQVVLLQHEKSSNGNNFWVITWQIPRRMCRMVNSSLNTQSAANTFVKTEVMNAANSPPAGPGCHFFPSSGDCNELVSFVVMSWSSYETEEEEEEEKTEKKMIKKETRKSNLG